MPQLAFYTLALLREPQDSPASAGFFDRTGPTFAAALTASGCVAVFSSEDPALGPMVAPQAVGHDVNFDQLVATLSVWQDLESVFGFAYSGVHAEALGHRKAWFVTPEWPVYVSWWLEDGDNNITWELAAGRLDKLHTNGPTPAAFDFRHPFSPDGQPVQVDRAAARSKNK